MRSAALLRRLRVIADRMVPTDPDANLIFIRVRRSNRTDDGKFLDNGPEVNRARGSLQVRWPEDPWIGEWTRDAYESECDFLRRVSAAVRPYATRQRVTVVARSGY